MSAKRELETLGTNNFQTAATNVEPGQSGSHHGLFNENNMREEQSDYSISADDDDMGGYDSNSHSEDDDSSLDSDQDSPHPDEPFNVAIKKWALLTCQNDRALDSLLAILRSKTNHKLPKDAQTMWERVKLGKKQRK